MPALLNKKTFQNIFFGLCAISNFVQLVKGETREQYFVRRNALLAEESNYMLGGHLAWESPIEKRANDILMGFKRKEYKEGLDGTNGKHFSATSVHYFHVKERIKDSHVFKIIKILPKGAALHMHDFTTGSVDFIVNKITYWPNLYMCYAPAITDAIEFRFFPSPPTTRCIIDRSNWTLVSEFRQKSSSVGYADKLFYRSMSFDTQTPELDYRDNNGAWKKFSKQIFTVTGILGYVESLRAYYNNLLQEYHDDNVMYIETRGRLENVYELDQTVLTEKQTLRIFEQTTKKFKLRNPKFLGAKYILAALRNYGQSKMTSLIYTAIDLKKSFPKFFAGFDMVFHENIGRTDLDYISQLLLASRNGIKFFFHAGETEWHNTRVDDNMMDAVLLNATRIGHGTALNGRPYIAEMIRKKKIGVEVNPISGQVLRLFEDYRAHPLVSLLHSDFPIVIASDDAGMWKARGLSFDWYLAFMGMGGQRADLRFLKQLALNSINYSAMSPREKRKALKLWKIKWETFLLQVISKYPISQG